MIICSKCQWYDDGVCRRRPPVVLPITSNEYEAEDEGGREWVSTEVSTYWPEVDKDDWCGFGLAGGQGGAAHKATTLTLPWACRGCGNNKYEAVREEPMGPVKAIILECTKCKMASGIEFAYLDTPASSEKSVTDIFRSVGFLELRCPSCDCPIMQNPKSASDDYACPRCHHEGHIDDFKIEAGGTEDADEIVEFHVRACKAGGGVHENQLRCPCGHHWWVDRDTKMTICPECNRNGVVVSAEADEPLSPPEAGGQGGAAHPDPNNDPSKEK